MAKLAWDIAGNVEKPWAMAFRAKFSSWESFWFVRPRASNFAIWKGILQARKIILEGACTIIANGRDVAYWLDQGERFDLANPCWKLIWSNHLHLRQSLLWRVCNGALSTRDKVSCDGNKNCIVCDLEVENLLHSFVNCHMARLLWFCSLILSRIDKFTGQNMIEVLLFLCKNIHGERLYCRMVVLAFDNRNMAWETFSISSMNESVLDSKLKATLLCRDGIILVISTLFPI
ncbi:hypothetical protein F8388_023650 [Cannabis sativa]|uniref:Reverse transcriptase zinc-binding domain-containing protein n=1 Tax=Cannabis sativa TaxID=3483 RepID=A0A7J6G9J5_CANSA|nr:hypothetical protein F8388_023650 [Cannabis sativa]